MKKHVNPKPEETKARFDSCHPIFVSFATSVVRKIFPRMTVSLLSRPDHQDRIP